MFNGDCIPDDLAPKLADSMAACAAAWKARLPTPAMLTSPLTVGGGGMSLRSGGGNWGAETEDGMLIDAGERILCGLGFRPEGP